MLLLHTPYGRKGILLLLLLLQVCCAPVFTTSDSYPFHRFDCSYVRLHEPGFRGRTRFARHRVPQD
jgi:hypothetical protein